MRAILIDPSNQTIVEVDYNGDWKTICPTIGCSMMDVVRLNQHDDMLVDDEGLMIDPNPYGYFTYMGRNPAYIAGKALILGSDEAGETVAATTPVADVVRAVRWGREPGHEPRMELVLF